jgi:hypothetical protein
MASEPGSPNALVRELAALGRAIVRAERERERRLQAKLAELDAWMDEATRVQRLLTGGIARREARLRALEDTVAALSAERARGATPRPLDIPREARFDASVVDMRGREAGPESEPGD